MADRLDLRVVGADQLAAFGRQLKAAGNPADLRKDLFRAANRTTKPVKDEVKAAAVRELPSQGGLNTWTAKGLRVTTKTRVTGRQVGVRISIKRPNPNNSSGMADISALNRGRVRHLTFGRGPWQIQTIQGGFIDRVMDGVVARRARREFLAALDTLAARIKRSA